MRLSSYVFAVASALLATDTTAGAIVIRHDVLDAAYLAKESDYPALFGLYRTKAGHKDCVATVISQRWAITAAHCARDKRLLEAAAPAAKGYSRKDPLTSHYSRRHLWQLLRISFLAPDIITAIVEGRQPRTLTGRALLRATDLPFDWPGQRRLLGFN